MVKEWEKRIVSTESYCNSACYKNTVLSFLWMDINTKECHMETKNNVENITNTKSATQERITS